MAIEGWIMPRAARSQVSISGSAAREKQEIACFSFFAGNQERNQFRKSMRLFNAQRSCWIVA